MSWYAALLIGLAPAAQHDPLVHTGSLEEGLRNPADVVVQLDGTVLATDLMHDHVARFDAAGLPIGAWPIPEGPIGIAVHPSNGNYYISLRDEGKVGVYSYDGGTDTLDRTGTLGDGNPMVTFIRPTDIDIATNTGRIYVVDPAGDRVYGFESNGSLALILGERGESIGQFLYPSAITIDEANDRLIVADCDNFRIHVFNTSGVFLQRFGYRIKYLVGGFQEGWMPRTQGLAVDAAGHIYVADALMSTVRVFDTTGTELGKVIEYGTGPGALRVPFAVALSADDSRLYVANTGASRVEIYETPNFARWSRSDAPQPQADSNPFRPAGTNWCAYDADRTGPAPPIRLGDEAAPMALKPRRAQQGRIPLLPEPPGTATSTVSSGYDGPHMIDASIICGRCHGIDGLPGGDVDLPEGQIVLCMSCHSGSGQAMGIAVRDQDRADPWETNPAADGLGRSHAWGVPAVNELTDSVGPTAGSPLEERLDAGGNIKCATCHDMHTSDAGQPYLRRANYHDQMCKECHAPRDKGPGEGGTHPVGFDFPQDEGEFPNDGDLPPLTLKEDRIECLTCHGVHHMDSGGANGGAGDGMLLRAANDETFCQTCHSEHSVHTVGGAWQPGCTECHRVHDPDNENLSLVCPLVYCETLGVDKPVVLTARTGPNGFGDSGPHNDGICQVCHTATAYHMHDGSGAGHYAGLDCTTCHQHSVGFLATCDTCHGQPPDGTFYPAGSHAIHWGETSQAQINDCSVCHAPLTDGVHATGAASFASGIDGNGDGDITLDETDVCNGCHSPDGPFDGVAQARSNWATATPVSCEGCHDSGSSTIQGVNAPPVVGDGTGAGFFVNGHGREGTVACDDCHDPTAPHFDGEPRTFAFDSAQYGPSQSGVAYAAAYRLRYVGGEVPLMIPGNYNITFGYNAALMRDTAFRLCFECHDSSKVFDDTPGDGLDTNFKASLPNPPRDYSYAWGSGADTNEHVSHILNYTGPFVDSDWDTGTTGPGGSDGRDSLTNCSSCHNVHGAAGTAGSTNEAMIRDGSFTGRTGYAFSYVVEDIGAGGYPMVTSTGATQSLGVGAIFRNNTADMCGGSMCHGDPAPPAAASYDASGSSGGTYLEYFRPGEP